MGYNLGSGFFGRGSKRVSEGVGGCLEAEPARKKLENETAENDES